MSLFTLTEDVVCLVNTEVTQDKIIYEMPQWEWAGGGICFNPHFYATEKGGDVLTALGLFYIFTFKYIFALYLQFSSYFSLFIDSFAL